ncbi:GNAT family N-acetyltransferase [Litorivita sp. NS0012-18]|uniref:GNAT family N-acetyltransferase n=1 Tax=Litorivita sp. NS0012-18 TaxID=3127655 RepID=UPI0033407990
MTNKTIDFLRLSAFDRADIAAHMSDARMAEHMPLLKTPWDIAQAEAFVAAKEATWAENGLGHWGFARGGRYLGWGGFQREGRGAEAEWDFGLVLRPEVFGLGPRIARQALAYARGDPRIPFVTFLLPPTRRHLRPLGRLGARRIGQVTHGGETFVKFRLETA